MKLNSCEINQVTSNGCQMDFLDKTCKKRSITEKANITIEFYIFEVVLIQKFILNWQFRIVGQSQPKKGISDLKKKKNEIHHSQ